MSTSDHGDLPWVVVHCDDQVREQKGQAFKRIEALVTARGYRYVAVADPWMLVWALDLQFINDPRCPPRSKLPVRALKQLCLTVSRAIAAKRLIIILDEDFSHVADDRTPQGSEFAPELTQRGIPFFRYTACYENEWNAAQQGRAVIYKEDRAESDAQQVLAQVRRMTKPL